VLDNLEQLLPTCATTVARLCGASGGLTILATSREPLRITGEHEYPVTPLVDADAVELFVQSARAVQPTFRPGDDQWAVIEAICTRLDRLPLALELAAARLRVLSLPDLLERLERRLPLLKGGGRDAPERQRTLQATIAWSYDLLTEVDQRAFARLSVFTGGASLDAAFDVCDVDLDAIEALVDKSLLRRADGPGRESRIAMLETIREFALDRLDEHPDADDVRRAHADYFLRAAEAAEPLLMGREQVTWLDRFENDHDNLRSALEWLLDHDPQRALRLAAALWLFWYMHGHVTEGRRWLQLALDKASPDPTLERAKALDGAGYLAGEQGDQSCRTLLEESLTCAREVGVPAVVAMAASHLSVFMGMDEGPQARALGEEAVALARRANDRYTLAVALNNLGQVFLYQFQDPTATKDMWKESLAIRREIGDASRVALSLSNLATLELLGGDFARAADFAREALELAEGIGDKRHMCFSHANLGWAALGQGRADEALEYFGRSLLLARDIGNAQGILENLMGFAAAAASTGEVLRAARLVGAVEALDDLVGVKLSETETAPLVERFIGAARSTVEVADWETARADGAAMNLDAAIRFASGTV
jgi:predicted ATPase